MNKLQCEVCGSTDIVKLDGDLFQCESCGCKYTQKQLRDKMSVTIEGPIQVEGIQSLEKLVANAEKLRELGEHLQAKKIFEKMTIEYPEDYRGWWGLVWENTLGLSIDETSVDEQTICNYKNALLLAPSGIKLDIQAQYVQFLDRCRKNAEKQVEILQSKIEENARSLTIKEEQLTELDGMMQSINKTHEEISNCSLRLFNLDKGIAELKQQKLSEEKSSGLGCLVFILAFIFLVGLLIWGSTIFWIGFVGFAILIITSIVHKLTRGMKILDLEADRNSADARKNQLYKTITRAKEEVLDPIDKCKACISEYARYIESDRQKIEFLEKEVNRSFKESGIDV